MSARLNGFGQPIGPALPDWSPRPRPPRAPMEGRFCRLVPLDAAAHADALYATYSAAPDTRGWTYLGDEMPESAEAYRARLATQQASDDPLFHAILDPASGDALGIASYLRIDPGNGVIEVGHIAFSPRLKRSRVATEAHYLLMRHVFEDLGYRRYEWKCDSLNDPSRRAAQRLGFCFEGIFRQAVVYRGRSRDTAWFSIIDGQWPQLRQAFQGWLQPENFDTEGRQRQALSTLTAPATPTTPSGD